MNVREATPEDEGWILDAFEASETFDPGFRIYHYLICENESGDPVGCGRLRPCDDETVELGYLVATEDEPTVLATLAEALVDRAKDRAYDTILIETTASDPYESVGFAPATWDEPTDAEATLLEWAPERAEAMDSSTEEPPEEEPSASRHKYDPSAAGGPHRESSSDETEPQDDSTGDPMTDAAKRQGIDPDRVQTKYGASSKKQANRSKYET